VVRGSATFALLMLSLLPIAVRAQGEPPAPYQRYTLQHADAQDIESMLSDLLSAVDPQATTAVDSRRNELVVTGTAEAHRLTQQLVESLDVQRRKPAQPILKPYRFEPAQLQSVADRLRQHFAAQPAVRITVDRNTAQLLVVATPEQHRSIANLLRAESFNETVETSESTSMASGPQRPPLAEAQSQYRLRNTRIERIEPILQAIFANRMQPQRRGPAGLPGYAISIDRQDAPAELVELGMDDRRNLVLIEGGRSIVAQLGQLLAALDSPHSADGRATRIVALRQAELPLVQRAVRALQGDLPVQATTPTRNDAKAKPSINDGAAIEEAAIRADASNLQNPQRLGRVDHAHRAATRMSDAIFQVRYQQPANQPAVVVPDPVPEAIRRLSQTGDEGGEDDLRQQRQGMDVEVETLPDLDVIIIRGRDRDVEELTRIIEEIERASELAKPEIVIMRLRHAPSTAVATIIQSVQAELLTGRQGRAVAAAIVKPNAVLVVGWGEAFESFQDLITKLDRPVAPESQFRVFRLAHAPAGNVAETITQFYANREGLGPVATVAPDERSNAIIVSASPRDLAEIELLIQRLDVPAGNAVNQMRVFRLEQSLAEDLAPVLEQAIRGPSGSGPAADQRSAMLELLTLDAKGQQLLKGGLLDDVQVTPDPHTNTLLVTAPPETMDLMAALIEQLDAEPAAVAQIKVFSVVNGDASSLVEMLRTLLGVPTSGGTRVQVSSAPGESSLAPLRFAVDQRTNSIIASGPAGDLAIVEAILLRLDQTDAQTRISKVYRLRNAPAVDVSNSINQYLRSERQVQQTAPGSLSPFRQIENEVVVVPEPVSNSLILSATPRYFEEIEELIEDLDAQPPQVMIQVLIAEVDLDDTEELGVELGLQDSLLFDRSLLSDIITTTTTTQTAAGQVANELIQSTTLAPGFNFNNETLGNNGSPTSLATREKTAGQGLTNFATGRINSELGYGGLVLSASSESVNILIRALRQTRRLRVLSRPQVMTLDNQPAFIQVGERVPRITSTQITQNAVINSVELENVGLILGVTPRVSPDGTVVMEVDAEKSALGPIADGIPVSILDTGEIVRSPVIDTTTAQTTVSATDGQTIVIGGLITKRNEEIHRKVPLLGDIPILGRLFRFDSSMDLRTELLIVLTPRVVRSIEDAERIKMEEAAKMHWCLSDVHAIHGDIGVCDPANCEQCDAETVVIYPDLNPQGFVPSDIEEGEEIIVEPGQMPQFGPPVIQHYDESIQSQPWSSPSDPESAPNLMRLPQDQDDPVSSRRTKPK